MKRSKKKTTKNIQKKRTKRNQRRHSQSSGAPRLLWAQGNDEFYEFPDNESKQPGIFSGMKIHKLDDKDVSLSDENEAEPGDYQIDLFF